MGRGPNIAPHKKGQPYLLPKSSYLSMNLYKVSWMDEQGRFYEDQQVLALTKASVINKITRKYGKPRPHHTDVRLVMRKGAFAGAGLKALR